jgi:hypothetical protein
MGGSQQMLKHYCALCRVTGNEGALKVKKKLPLVEHYDREVSPAFSSECTGF